MALISAIQQGDISLGQHVKKQENMNHLGLFQNKPAFGQQDSYHHIELSPGKSVVWSRVSLFRKLRLGWAELGDIRFPSGISSSRLVALRGIASRYFEFALTVPLHERAAPGVCRFVQL